MYSYEENFSIEDRSIKNSTSASRICFKLTDFDDYTLLLIIEKCSDEDIENLYFVNNQFRSIIEKHVYQKQSSDLVVSGHKNTISFNRTINNLSYYDRIRLNRNMSDGRYEELVYFDRKKWYPSLILLDKEFVYVTHYGKLCGYNRLKKYFLDTKASINLGKSSDSDITCLAKHNNIIVAGRANGSCTLFENEDVVNEQVDNVNEYINDIDFHGDLLVTTSKSITKLWRRQYELNQLYLEPLYAHDEGFKTVHISHYSNKVAAGKNLDRSRQALRMLDIETCTEHRLQSNVLAVYSVLWKDSNIIFSGNFDCTFRAFDCRTNRDEHIWMDPFDSSIYCLSYDGQYGVFCGMKYHCRVNLYDLRVPKKYIQIYFPTIKRHTNSTPVYGLASDCSQLFVSTGFNLRIFNFDADWAKPKNYNDIFAQ